LPRSQPIAHDELLKASLETSSTMRDLVAPARSAIASEIAAATKARTAPDRGSLKNDHRLPD
jgi:hypothetical protein